MVASSVLNIALMGPMQGFGSCLSGRLIFSFEMDCNRTGFIAVEAPFGGILKTAHGGLSRLLMQRRAAKRNLQQWTSPADDKLAQKRVVGLLIRGSG